MEVELGHENLNEVGSSIGTGTGIEVEQEVEIGVVRMADVVHGLAFVVGIVGCAVVDELEMSQGDSTGEANVMA